MEAAAGTMLHAADTRPLGLATEEMFAASWPERGCDVLIRRSDQRDAQPAREPIEAGLNTLPEVTWRNSQLIAR